MKTTIWRALLLCMLAWPVLAAPPLPGNVDAEVAGHDYLEGVMETGSELLSWEVGNERGRYIRE